MRTTDEPVRVLYVSGWVYSGSTLLSNILGEIEGVFAAGEVRHIWRRGLLEDRPCGCGAAFSACPFWSAVVEEAFGNVEELPFLDDRRVELGPNHNLAGNPNRFRSGAVEIRLDDAWRRDLPVRERALAVALTWPILLRHGYLDRG